MYGLQDIPPHHYVETTLNEHNWRFNYSKPCRGENCDIYQTRMQQGAFGIRLDPVECLSAFTTSFGNQSDVILVSTYDLATNTTVAEDLTLLFAAEEYRLLGPGYSGPALPPILLIADHLRSGRTIPVWYRIGTYTGTN